MGALNKLFLDPTCLLFSSLRAEHAVDARCKSNAFERGALVVHALGDYALAAMDHAVATELVTFYAHFERVDDARELVRVRSGSVG